ncbi:hypothetical protein [Segatella paludivivens]|uniref:hypothetical protein n=1 Tax=Segatella paludivivens TaxID=185294 RepID=UPI00035E1AB0|nr:hypothetical protein [Segatella paludivivens]
MEKNFDFDKIGKNTPYFTPEGFFDEMQKKILLTAERDIRKHRRMKIAVITLLAAAAVFSGFVFFPIGNDIAQPQQQKLAKTDTAKGKTSTVHSTDIPTYSSTKENKDRVGANGELQISDRKRTYTTSVIQSDRNTPNEEWIEQLSDEDLKSLTSMADNDEFLN